MDKARPDTLDRNTAQFTAERVSHFGQVGPGRAILLTANGELIELEKCKIESYASSTLNTIFNRLSNTRVLMLINSDEDNNDPACWISLIKRKARETDPGILNRLRIDKLNLWGNMWAVSEEDTLLLTWVGYENGAYHLKRMERKIESLFSDENWETYTAEL